MLVVISPQIQAAEQRRQEFVTQGIAEQRVEQMLGSATPGWRSVPPLERPSLPLTLRRPDHTARSFRSLLTRMAMIALGATPHEAAALVTLATVTRPER
jgi:hypothetical protein